MAKRELDAPEGGTGDKISYDPIILSKTAPVNAPKKTEVTNRIAMATNPVNAVEETGKDRLIKLIESKWSTFEKLSSESKSDKARRKFDGLWSELGRNIVDQGIVNLPKKKQKQKPGSSIRNPQK